MTCKSIKVSSEVVPNAPQWLHTFVRVACTASFYSAYIQCLIARNDNVSACLIHGRTSQSASDFVHFRRSSAAPLA